MNPLSSYLYVSPDGNYGDARGLIIIDISEWTDDELREFDDESDNGRYKMSITKKHN